jgi:glycosyltransferase involved in cell wall biosynthesis
MLPKISVCIPVKDGGAFLPLAVESVLAQARDDFELVIADNCSTDGTAAWVEQLAAKRSFVRFYKNSSNIGMAANFNVCLRHAKGEYIKFLCADDLLLPNCLQQMACALDCAPHVALVVGGRRLIDESGRIIVTQRYTKQDVVVPGTEVINRCIFGTNYIGEPSAVMFRRGMAERGFQEAFSQLVDLEMWFHLLERGMMMGLADELCAIRRHPGQLSVENIRSGALVEDNIRLFMRYGKKPYVKNTFFNRTMRNMRVAHRVWICRGSMTVKKRNHFLESYSSRLLYHCLVAPLGGLRFAWRKLTATG